MLLNSVLLKIVLQQEEAAQVAERVGFDSPHCGRAQAEAVSAACPTWSLISLPAISAPRWTSFRNSIAVFCKNMIRRIQNSKA